MNAKNRIVVNFASVGRENYLVGSQRLFETMVAANVDADLLICSPDLLEEEDLLIDGRMVYKRKRYPISMEFGICPPHQEAPYAFKTYIIQEARDMGYTKILWADSSCVFLKDVETYWKLAEEVGVVLMDNPGCPEATWTADDCLEHMGCDPEFAKTFYEIDAFMMIFDFSSLSIDPDTAKVFKTNTPVSHILFEKYFEHSRDGICLKGIRGSTRPDFKAHRHDQSIMSYFAKLYNLHPVNYSAWSYAHEVGINFNPTFVKCGVSQLLNWRLVIEMHKENKNIMGVSFV
jgi:hypothetical protein